MKLKELCEERQILKIGEDILWEEISKKFRNKDVVERAKQHGFQYIRFFDVGYNAVFYYEKTLVNMLESTDERREKDDNFDYWNFMMKKGGKLG